MNINKIIATADIAQKKWRNHLYRTRASDLCRVADILEANADKLADLMLQEVHKPYAQGIAEIKKSAWVCRHFAQASEGYLATQNLDLGASKAELRYEPMGIVFGIMPWNFPFWQVFRMAAPALVAGNAVLIKHAPGTPLCAKAIQEILDEAGLPEGIYTNLEIGIPEVESVIAHRLVRLVTLTGSERAGRAVAALAGKYLKKCVLELGGSDAFIVCASADVTAAATAAITSRTNNNGQTCNSAKRFLVHYTLYDIFIRNCITILNNLETINEQEDNIKNKKTVQLTELFNPIITENLYRQVADAQQKGAKIVYKKGDFDFPKTNLQPLLLLTKITPEMAIYHEEIFGTMATITPFHTDIEAINLANDTDFGLAASIFTQNPAQANSFIQQLEVGTVAINQAVSSDPRLPFGGTKNSGFGRELGAEGIRELCNLKTIVRA